MLNESTKMEEVEDLEEVCTTLTFFSFLSQISQVPGNFYFIDFTHLSYYILHYQEQLGASLRVGKLGSDESSAWNKGSESPVKSSQLTEGTQH